jgi:hypothetical protein
VGLRSGERQGEMLWILTVIAVDDVAALGLGDGAE